MPADLGGIGGVGRCSGVACRGCRGSPLLPAVLAVDRPSAVASWGFPLVRLLSSAGLKPVKMGYSPLVYLL
jgi:hypothetical protein